MHNYKIRISDNAKQHYSNSDLTATATQKYFTHMLYTICRLSMQATTKYKIKYSNSTNGSQCGLITFT